MSNEGPSEATTQSAETWLHERPNVLLSIDPEWAEAILEGEKRWEYRKAPPNRTPPYRLVLYATAPTKAAVGRAYVGTVLKCEVDDLVALTVDETPHDASDLREYFGECDTGYALRMDSTRRFDEPHGLTELRRTGCEPAQNFRYLNPCDLDGSDLDV